MTNLSASSAPVFNPQSLAQMDKARFTAYANNLNFYNGQHWTETSKNRQLVFNYAKVAVDKLTSYLMEGFSFACDPIDNQKDIAQRAEQVIYDVYNANGLQQLDYETEIDAAILGDACYKVTWDTAEKRIRVTSPDVNGLYAWWLGDDLGIVERGCLARLKPGTTCFF